jgi:hypothetical protein
MKLLPIKSFTTRSLVMVIAFFIFGANEIAAGDPPANPALDCNPLLKPRPGCLPTPSARPAPSAQSQSLTPSPPLNREDYEKAERTMKEGTGRITPSGRLSPEKVSADIQWYKDNAQITLKSKGGVFTAVADGSKFLVFLDDEKFPVKSLFCEPKGVIDLMPVQDTGRGPDMYPVMFMAVAPGKCVLRNRDFSVTVIVDEPLVGQ